MSPLRSSKKWVLAAIGILLTLFILKIALFLTAKPKITVDYVAEYNRASRPQNYDPNENAAPYYQKAFDAFVDAPDELRWTPYIDWPADFNNIEQALLEKWLTSNTQAFEYFKEALDKPYYWLERQAGEDNFMGSMMLPELAPLRQLTRSLIWEAKLRAVKGQFQSAVEDIIACYAAGRHKCRPNLFLMEQHVGLGVKQDAVGAALIILGKSNIRNNPDALEFMQSDLQKELGKDTYVPGSQAERLLDYDMLQRTFVDNGRRTGRLWWRIGFGVTIPLAGEGRIRERKIRLSCFTGPTKKQAAEQVELTFSLFNQAITKTPWQIKSESYDYFKEIENINKRHISLECLGIGIDPNNIFHSYHRTKAQTEALIAILTILQYKADTGQFPESLDKLVSTGYLQALPNDPYSDGPLVYKFTEDNFKLYSIGEDFSDDGGVSEVVNKARQGTGFRGTGIAPYVHSPDIVYWPVKELKKLCYEFTLE